MLGGGLIPTERSLEAVGKSDINLEQSSHCECVVKLERKY